MQGFELEKLKVRKITYDWVSDNIAWGISMMFLFLKLIGVVSDIDLPGNAQDITYSSRVLREEIFCQGRTMTVIGNIVVWKYSDIWILGGFGTFM